MSVSESDKFSDLDEEGSTREETTGISGLSIPDLIQTYDDEEIFSGRDFWASSNEITFRPI
jgi:hypothetical protein